MKLTVNKAGANEDEDHIGCPIVDNLNNIWEFFRKDDSQLYTFKTLCKAQQTTQVLLERMVQDLQTGINNRPPLNKKLMTHCTSFLLEIFGEFYA